MIEVRPQSWFVIKYLRAVFENVHISIFIPFHSLNIWGKGFLKMYTFCTVIHCRQHKCWFCSPLTIPLTFQSSFFLKLHWVLWCHGTTFRLFYPLQFCMYLKRQRSRKVGWKESKLFGNGEGRPFYLCAQSALVSILEQLERLRCTSLSLSVRQRAGYTQKSASLVGQIWRTNIGQIWNGNLQNCWEKEERMRRGALSLSNKEQPYLIFASFWTPPHYLGLRICDKIAKKAKILRPQC